MPEEASIPEEEAGKPRSFSVMAKPVGSQCNLACSYCYYLKSEASARPDGQKRMTDAILERYIRQYIKASPDQEISFVWHGGEPTLAGLDFFRQVVKIQKRYLPKRRTVRNNLQTNGVLLDDEWCAFLAEEDFDVGLSIDGAQWIHDQYRRDHSGRGSYASASEAVRRMLQYGLR
ncbi:MAG: radical SAM protein, partial [Clostridiales bacterium]|nr:radical SAM protein [Clostridiales bacterium]